MHSAAKALTLLILLLACGARVVGQILASTECKLEGDYFDTMLQQCSKCADIDPRAVPTLPYDVANSATTGSFFISAEIGFCKCAPGLVQCAGGEACLARSTNSPDQEEQFIAQAAIECRDCPFADADGKNLMAPTEDRRQCLPCHVGVAGDNSTTLGYSAELADCMCPPGHALVERDVDGSYLNAKSCVLCAQDTFPGPQGESLAVYGCIPCPDPRRMYRNPETGACDCRKDQGGSEGFVSAGGVCVDLSEFDEVDSKFPAASAAEVQFRDLISGRESFWFDGPFGHYLGIEHEGDNTMDVLSLDMARSSTTQVSSAVIKWLYIRCAVGCMRGNQTACQCISNLCVLALYDEQAVTCKFLKRNLYEGRTPVSPATPGHLKGTPWLFYEPQRPIETIQDTSVAWTFSLSAETSGDTTGMLIFWLARYSLEGQWLGWERVDHQLELCGLLGGGSGVPQSPEVSWRRFGSSLVSRCKVLLTSILRCGYDMVFYELFLENSDGSLIPVPVRILNLVKDQERPNRNFETEDLQDDAFVRRFTLCDSITGREGPPEAYFVKVPPRVFRWAAHMAVMVQIRPDSPAQIYVPILSIAYAEVETGNVQHGDVTDISFRSEYSMDVSSFWTTMLVFIIILSLSIALLSGCRMYMIERRYPPIPPEPIGADPGLFVPKPVLWLYAFFSTAYNVLFWFHFFMAMYWLFTFKNQDAPHLLLPSASLGDQYVPHDVVMVIYTCLGFFCVGINLFKALRSFVFLVDWERATPGSEDVPRIREDEQDAAKSNLFRSLDYNMGLGGGYGQGGSGGYGQGGYGYGQGNFPMDASGGQMVGAPLLNAQMFRGSGSSAPGTGPMSGDPLAAMQQQGHLAQLYQQQMQQLGMNDFPDRGVSAWRSLFICNELNERLKKTRTTSYVTWLAMAALLEGIHWKDGARWYPSFDTSDYAISAARYNPFLQFALCTLIWLFVIALQLVVQRVLSIVVGHPFTDFVDVCSVANVSILFMDEPFHGYYIHGKAPTSRGEWCHTELAKVLHDEEKGIGFSRGLTPESCQTFEVFFPAELKVSIPGGTVVPFRHELYKIFANVRQTQMDIANRKPPKPNEADVVKMSRFRCQVQVLIDTIVLACQQRANEIIQVRKPLEKFMGAPPPGGVGQLHQPVFFEDQGGIAWASTLAYGTELRLCCVDIGLPTGFEWHLISLELVIFNIVWRFGGSIYLAVAFAFLLNQVVLRLYATAGRRRLAHTTVINSMFLI
mmetsp:Transcript_30065/g.55535  ORF Transcript_30065/g.55535 Transcript_30065/m.55535 type:complete len:1241 (-) Transcript_30065:47-3769(-)